MIGTLHGGLLLQSGRLSLKTVQLLTQEPDVILALLVLFLRASVLDDSSNDRHNECEDKTGELDAVL